MVSDNGHRGVMGAAVADAAAELERRQEAAAGEQLPMFAVPTRFAASADELQAAAERDRRGPGRPPGARNRSTRELRTYLLSRGADPLEQSVRWLMHTPESLARELNCTQLEAFDRLQTMRRDALPYLYGKVGLVDDDGKPVPMLFMQIGGSSAAPGATAAPWDYMNPADPPREQNQALSVTVNGVSHDDKSHGDGK